jgi:hypothetical protein
MSIDPLGTTEVTAAIRAAFERVEPAAPAPPWFGEVFEVSGVYRVALRGAALRVELGCARPRGRKPAVLGVYVGVDAPDFPFELQVTGVRRSVGDLGVVDVGDPSFRAALTVFTNRPELAQAILDAAALANLGATEARVSWAMGAATTYLSIRDGVVRWFVPVRKTWAALGPPAPGAAMTADDLRASAEQVLALVARLTAAIERARREVEARGGPGAFAAWIAAERAALTRTKQEWQRTKRILVRRIIVAVLVSFALTCGVFALGPSIWQALFGDARPAAHRPPPRRR